MVKLHFLIQLKQVYMFTFTFMHLADAFIQSDLQCIQAIHFFNQYVMFNKSNKKNTQINQYFQSGTEEGGYHLVQNVRKLSNSH